MKITLYILLLFVSNFYSQTHPIDSTFYDGTIKSIRFKNDWVYKANTVDVYYASICRDKSKTLRIADSAKGWIKEARHFYRDSTFVVKDFGKSFAELGGVTFIIESYEAKHLSIYLKITKDSLIDRVAIQRSSDNLDFPYRKGKTIYWLDLNIPTEISELQPVNLDVPDGSISMKFYRKYFVKEIRYSRCKDKRNFLHTVYQFYIDNKLKQQGTYLVGFGRKGKWYSYYENGRLFSEGEYDGSVFNERGEEISSKKNKKWVYYTEDGCIEKEEIWQKGLLKSEKLIAK